MAAAQGFPQMTQVPPGSAALRDIQGIDGVPWWPPAPVWWWLAGAILLIVLILFYWRPAPRWALALPVLSFGTWRRSATRELRALRRRAATQSVKQTAGELSELLRRIAMARLGRSACAGLTGDDWLRWLAANDPNGFDWTEHGQVLITAPYAPPAADDGGPALATLLDATAAWVTSTPQRPDATPKEETAGA